MDIDLKMNCKKLKTGTVTNCRQLYQNKEHYLPDNANIFRLRSYIELD